MFIIIKTTTTHKVAFSFGSLGTMSYNDYKSPKHRRTSEKKADDWLMVMGDRRYVPVVDMCALTYSSYSAQKRLHPLGAWCSREYGHLSLSTQLVKCPDFERARFAPCFPNAYITSFSKNGEKWDARETKLREVAHTHDNAEAKIVAEVAAEVADVKAVVIASPMVAAAHDAEAKVVNGSPLLMNIRAMMHGIYHTPQLHLCSRCHRVLDEQTLLFLPPDLQGIVFEYLMYWNNLCSSCAQIDDVKGVVAKLPSFDRRLVMYDGDDVDIYADGDDNSDISTAVAYLEEKKMLHLMPYKSQLDSRKFAGVMSLYVGAQVFDYIYRDFMDILRYCEACGILTLRDYREDEYDDRDDRDDRDERDDRDDCDDRERCRRCGSLDCEGECRDYYSD